MAQILTQVRLGTTQNVDLNEAFSVGVDSIDGKLIYAGNRILVKAQSNRIENGIYTIESSGFLARSSDFALGSTQTPSSIIFIQEGNELADTGWLISSDSNTNTITVGMNEIEFTRFSLNLNILGADLPSSIVLRSEKGYPLTITELDNNFKYLSISLTQKLNIKDFTQTAICDRINSVDYSVSNINANNLRGFYPSTEVIDNLSTIALRSESGNILSNTFTGDLIGNADSADFATLAQTAHALDNVNPIQFGGTGANNAADARVNLNVVNRAGDSMTGKLSLAPATSGYATLNIPTQTNSINSPIDGDIWSNASSFFYRKSNVTYTFAPLESPAFTGTPISTNPAKTSNSGAIATTNFVQQHVADLNASILLKSDINSPVFTGDPKAPTPPTNDNDTSIATTAFVNNLINTITPSYYTKQQADIIHNAETSTRTANDNALSSRIDELTKMKGIPIGAVMYYAASNVPVGWLKCDGALVSKNAFPHLFSKIGYTYGGVGNDFRLPDLRGEFLRGWDDGRGIDRGRQFGTWEKGTLVTFDPNYGSYNVTSVIGRYNYSGATNSVSWNDTDDSTGKIGLDHVFNAQTMWPEMLRAEINNAPTPQELATNGWGYGMARPRNVAMLACIKAYGDIDNPDLITAAAVLESISYKVDKRGDIMSGRLTLSGDPLDSLHAATKQYVDTAITRVDNRVAKAGDTMSGFLTLVANPTQPMHAATKDYVDTIVKSQPIALSLDTRGLSIGDIVSLLNTIAPPNNYMPYTLCRIAATAQNVSTRTDNYRAGWISITYVYWVNAITTVNNPDRNNNFVFRVNANKSSWEYVAG